MDRRAFLSVSLLLPLVLASGCGGGGSSSPDPSPSPSPMIETGFGIFRSVPVTFPSEVALVDVLPNGDFVVSKRGTIDRSLLLPGIISRGSGTFTPIKFIAPDGSQILEYINSDESAITVSGSGKILVRLRGLKSGARWFIVDPSQPTVQPEAEVSLPNPDADNFLAPNDVIYSFRDGHGTVHRRTSSGRWNSEPLDSDFVGSDMMRWTKTLQRFGVLFGKTSTPLSQAAYIKDGVITRLPHLFAGRSCEALAYGADGAVLGRTVDDSGVPHGVLWKGGAVVDLGPNFVPQFFSLSGAFVGGAGSSSLTTSWESPRVSHDGLVVPYKIAGPGKPLTKRFPLLTLVDGTFFIAANDGSTATYYELKPTW